MPCWRYAASARPLFRIHAIAALVFPTRHPETFSIEMCRMMLARTPPMLILKGNKYYLFVGYREWQLALYKLDRTEKISCQIVKDAADSLLNEMAWNDAYGAALSYGFNPKRMGQQCNQAVVKTGREFEDKFFPELSSVRQFAKVTDISRASFIPMLAPEALQLNLRT